MKIIEVIPHLKSGGAEKFVVDLSASFANKGQEVHIVTLFDPSEDDLLYSQISNKVKKKSLGKKLGSNWKTFFKLLYYIRTENPDTVHLHIGAIKYGLISALLYRKCNYFATIHSEAKREAGKGIEKYIRKILFGLKLITPVTISDESERSFKNFYGYHALMIPNGTAPNELGNLCELRKKFHSDVNYLFVHAGRIHPVKNQVMLVSAIEDIINMGYNIRLLLLGRNDNDEIMSFINTHLSDKIQYIGEIKNVRDYVAIADAFCLTSHQEGLPITALEAFSVGTPVISTPVGGCINVVKEGYTGYLSKEVTKKAYINSLLHFMSLPSNVRNQMKTNCLDEYNKKYSIETCAKRYLEVFNR